MCSLITGLLISFVLVLFARLFLQLLWKLFLYLIICVLWLLLQLLNLIAWPFECFSRLHPKGESQ
jgi:hypothetical protein